MISAAHADGEWPGPGLRTPRARTRDRILERGRALTSLLQFPEQRLRKREAAVSVPQASERPSLASSELQDGACRVLAIPRLRRPGSSHRAPRRRGTWNVANVKGN